MFEVFRDQNPTWPSSTIEYYIVDRGISKVLWLCTDGDKVWTVDLGDHKIPPTARESSFLDVLIVTGVAQATLEQVYKDSQYGIFVSFDKGVPGQRKNIFDIKPDEVD